MTGLKIVGSILLLIKLFCFLYVRHGFRSAGRTFSFTSIWYGLKCVEEYSPPQVRSLEKNRCTSIL